LFSVDGSPALLSNHLDSILVLHPELNESRGDQDRGPAEASNAVNANTGIRVGLELLIDEVQPFVHDLLGRCRPVREAQLGHLDFLLFKLLRVVEFIRGADEVGDLVLLQEADVVVHGAVLRLVGDEEAHIPAQVPVFDLGKSGANDLPSHFDADRTP